MKAVIVNIACRQRAELVEMLRGLLAHAEQGDLRGLCGFVRDTKGAEYAIINGAYCEPGAAIRAGFLLQLQAANDDHG